MNGSVLSYFEIIEPDIGEQIYNSKIAPLYDSDIEDFRSEIGYYSQNWVWFGMALYHDKLINLYGRI